MILEYRLDYCKNRYYSIERIPICYEQAIKHDYTKPFILGGREYWILESPEFRLFSDTTLVKALRYIEGWEVTIHISDS